ncbi:MAG: hypothetical protein AAGF60_13865 [Pseudomonadota bacterium]
MRHAILPLLASSVLHVAGFVLVDFAASSLFLLFPAGLYVLLSVGLWRDVRWTAWLTLICMLGGVAGTALELLGPLMAPVPILVAIIVADLIAATLLIRALLRPGAR